MGDEDSADVKAFIRELEARVTMLRGIRESRAAREIIKTLSMEEDALLLEIHEGIKAHRAHHQRQGLFTRAGRWLKANSWDIAKLILEKINPILGRVAQGTDRTTH